jgi:hypothetical protein
MRLCSPLAADEQSPELVQPAEALLNDLAMRPGRSQLCCAAVDYGFEPPARTEPPPVLVMVMPAIGTYAVGRAPRTAD